MKSWGPGPYDEPPEPRVVANTPIPSAPVVELGELGPDDECPLCAQRCFCGHTLMRPWTPGEEVRCHNCGALNKPLPPRVVSIRSDGGTDD